jgi:hypothetical protein
MSGRQADSRNNRKRREPLRFADEFVLKADGRVRHTAQERIPAFALTDNTIGGQTQLKLLRNAEAQQWSTEGVAVAIAGSVKLESTFPLQPTFGSNFGGFGEVRAICDEFANLWGGGSLLAECSKREREKKEGDNSHVSHFGQTQSDLTRKQELSLIFLKSYSSC